MSQFQQWLTMGGYSTYIWSAYGLVGLVFLMNLINIKFQRKRTRKKLQQWFKRP